MADGQVYALKGHDEWAETVHASLLAGVGRFGWSSARCRSRHPQAEAVHPPPRQP